MLHLPWIYQTQTLRCCHCLATPHHEENTRKVMLPCSTKTEPPGIRRCNYRPCLIVYTITIVLKDLKIKFVQVSCINLEKWRRLTWIQVLQYSFRLKYLCDLRMIMWIEFLVQGTYHKKNHVVEWIACIKPVSLDLRFIPPISILSCTPKAHIYTGLSFVALGMKAL